MIFSAAGAHMAISLCDTDELAVSAYESFINFNPEHIKTFLQTGKFNLCFFFFCMGPPDIINEKFDFLKNIKITKVRRKYYKIKYFSSFQQVLLLYLN
jgi:hypothetical protein